MDEMFCLQITSVASWTKRSVVNYFLSPSPRALKIDCKNSSFRFGLAARGLHSFIPTVCIAYAGNSGFKIM